LMETLARSGVYSYSSDSRLRDGAHRIAGDIRFARDSHPQVFVESGSHGVFAASDPHSRYSAERSEFSGGTGVTYRFGGTAARPAHANDRDISYELLSAYDHLWSHAASRQDDATFAEFFRYSPSGNRPRAATDEIPGAFMGRKYTPNQARPFWAWSDP